MTYVSLTNVYNIGVPETLSLLVKTIRNITS